LFLSINSSVLILFLIRKVITGILCDEHIYTVGELLTQKATIHEVMAPRPHSPNTTLHWDMSAKRTAYLPFNTLPGGGGCKKRLAGYSALPKVNQGD